MHRPSGEGRGKTFENEGGKASREPRFGKRRNKMHEKYRFIQTYKKMTVTA